MPWACAWAAIWCVPSPAGTHVTRHTVLIVMSVSAVFERDRLRKTDQAGAAQLRTALVWRCNQRVDPERPRSRCGRNRGPPPHARAAPPGEHGGPRHHDGDQELPSARARELLDAARRAAARRCFTSRRSGALRFEAATAASMLVARRHVQHQAKSLRESLCAQKDSAGALGRRRRDVARHTSVALRPTARCGSCVGPEGAVQSGAVWLTSHQMGRRRKRPSRLVIKAAVVLFLS